MKKYLNIHTHRTESSENEIALCNVFLQDYENYRFLNNEFYSTGLHPWHMPANGLVDALIKTIETAAHDERIIAVGECGLDRKISIPLEIQTNCLLSQLKIAESVRKPVILHSVRTMPEIISLRKKNKLTAPCIVHGFSGNIHEAKQLTAHGIYLSFGKYLYRGSPQVCKVFSSVNKKFVFLEDDEENIPIEELYGIASEVAACTSEELRDQIWSNFRDVFGITP